MHFRLPYSSTATIPPASIVNLSNRAPVCCLATQSLNGIPTRGDANLMNGLLRGAWNWSGFVVSDYDAWAQIYTTHKYTKTMQVKTYWLLVS